MKLFGRTSGYYLFWTGFIYFWAGMYLAFTHTASPEYATLGFVLALSVPLWCPPVARYFNMEPLMFNMFGKKNKTPSNVVPFPEPKSVPAVPYVEPPKEPEKPAVTYYRLGITNNSRVSFQMGYSEITMNAAGIDNMIKQLECFRDQIAEYEGDDE
jgi:hypothetical protein